MFKWFWVIFLLEPPADTGNGWGWGIISCTPNRLNHDHSDTKWVRIKKKKLTDMILVFPEWPFLQGLEGGWGGGDLDSLFPLLFHVNLYISLLYRIPENSWSTASLDDMDKCVKLILTHNLRSHWEKSLRPLLFVISSKGSVTPDDSQGRFFAQHGVGMLKQCCNHSKLTAICCNASALH